MLFLQLLSSLEPDELVFFNDIYERYHKHILVIANGIIKNHHDAEEVLDDVMMSIIQNIRKFMNSETDEIEAQIVIYARNASINRYNKNKRSREKTTHFSYADEENGAQVFDEADPEGDPAQLVISQETAEIVQRCLKRLPVEQQDVIQLVYMLGYSYAETAELLHITPNAVGMRIHHAKKKLLTLIGGEPGERL